MGSLTQLESTYGMSAEIFRFGTAGVGQRKMAAVKNSCKTWRVETCITRYDTIQMKMSLTNSR